MRLVVLGGGESGVGTAILGQKKGYEVFVSDFGPIAAKYQSVLNENAIPWEEKTHSEDWILNADLVMKSPGIPDKAPIVQKLLSKGISVISEIEFASTFTDAKIIGITGSNGKTTTTLLIYHLLKNEGYNVGLAGNIGKSFALQVAEKNFDYYVLELSSFQLDGIITFRPHIAIITNISPDHLDRYEYDYNLYIASKFRITMNQTSDDYFIYDNSDEAISNWLQTNSIKAQKIPFSLEETPLLNGAYLEIQNIISTINKENFMIPINEIAIKGKHNVKNAMAAITTGELIKIRKKTIKDSLANFEGPEHRLEFVKKVNSVTYINDSKATNVNSVFYALDSMMAPTIWIVGGVDKGNDYDILLPYVRDRVKAVICLGVDNFKLLATFGNVVDVIEETISMVDAVAIANKLSEPGDTVLFSPACASFDLFDNFEDRGKQFKNAVFNL